MRKYKLGQEEFEVLGEKGSQMLRQTLRLKTIQTGPVEGLAKLLYLEC